MKALFYTTSTADALNHVRAWDAVFPKAEHLIFDHMGIRNDWRLPEAVNACRPDVVFYIGSVNGPGIPRHDSFRQVRQIVYLSNSRRLTPSRSPKVVNVCSDAADRPWHAPLETMKACGAVDLNVSIDGAKDAPVDLATLTPVDPRPFAVAPERDIRCGFSGSVGRGNDRSEIVKALMWFGGLTVRDRGMDYEDHARFLKRCRMVINHSKTGSQMAHHIKGRVVEAGWAGCCLLESKGSPIGQWFPDDCYILYDGPQEAKALIDGLDDGTIRRTAARLAAEVQGRFRPEQVYGEMLAGVGLTAPVLEAA